MICRRAGEIGALASGSLIAASLGAADFTSSLEADFTLASGLAVVVARFESPNRCTLPITALRVTPPNSFAIWLADWP